MSTPVNDSAARDMLGEIPPPENDAVHVREGAGAITDAAALTLAASARQSGVCFVGLAEFRARIDAASDESARRRAASAPDAIASAAWLRTTKRHADADDYRTLAKAAGVRTTTWDAAEADARQEILDRAERTLLSSPRVARSERPSTTAPNDGDGGSNDDNDTRVRVEVTTREGQVGDAVLAAITADEDLFARGGALVRAVAARDGIRRSTRIEDVPRPALREIITRHVAFFEVKRDRNGTPYETDVHPPQWCVEALHARGTWPGVRPLDGVTDAPVMRPDGTVLDVPGYDIATGYLFRPSRNFARSPEQPTEEEGRDAMARIRDVVSEFIFDGAGPHEHEGDNRLMHEAAALALPLTLVARTMLDGSVPAFLIDAPDSSAGKTNLAQTLVALATGEIQEPCTWDTKPEEWVKSFLAQLLKGERVIFYDNVPTGAEFGHAHLDAAITSGRSWSGRVLGASKQVTVPNNAVIVATGNNPRVPNDTVRRVIRVRLEKRAEEKRAWKYQLPREAAERATTLAADLATALRAWIVAGRPQSPHVEASGGGAFDAWAAIVPQCLAWYGYPDIRGTQEALRADEESKSALAAVVEAWCILDPRDEGIAAGRLQRMFERLARGGLDPSVDRAALETLRDGIEGLDRRGRRAADLSARSIGRILAASRGAKVNGYYLSPSTARTADRPWHVRGPARRPKDQLQTRPSSRPGALN